MGKTLAKHSINHWSTLDMGSGNLKHQFTDTCGHLKGSRGAIINPPIKLDWVAKMFQAPIHQGTISSISFCLRWFVLTGFKKWISTSSWIWKKSDFFIDLKNLRDISLCLSLSVTVNRPTHPHTIVIGKLCALLEFASFQCHQLDIGLGQDAMRHTHIRVPVEFWLCTWVTFHLRG